MADALKRTFTLKAEQASYIDKLVENGSYADENEVVQAGLDALHARPEDIEAWLRDEVLPACERYEKNPELAVDAEIVFEEIRAHHLARLSRS